MLTLKFRVTRVARPRNTLFGNIAREWSDKSKFVKVVKPAKSPACNASIFAIFVILGVITEVWEGLYRWAADIKAR